MIRNPSEIPKNNQGNDRDYVVQEYIDNPLIVDSKKFDLRLYVLISSIDPLLVYLNDEGLARFCTEDYERPSMKNIGNKFGIAYLFYFIEKII